MISSTTVIILFSIATAVALATRRLGIPYTVALVGAGLALGATHVLEPPHLTKELLYGVFLPGLVFEAAFHLDTGGFRRDALLIGALAVPGLAIALALTAAIFAPAAIFLREAQGMGFVHALVFASVVAATDPIAVVSLFRSLGVPKRLGLLVEGESLLNDGTAIVVFSLVLAMVSGSSMSIARAILQFFTVVGAGALIGAVLGYVISRVVRRVEDPMIEITLTAIAAYGSFGLAESFHASGVIATVAAGMLCRSSVAHGDSQAAARIAVESFWDYIAFALNSLVFLLVGFEVRIGALLADWKLILFAWLAITIARALMIALLGGLLARSRAGIPWSWSAVLVWGGLRGALSMVLVLGLPPDFPFRDLLVTTTFGVVILSISVQGLTMKKLLGTLRLASLDSRHRA